MACPNRIVIKKLTKENERDVLDLIKKCYTLYFKEMFGLEGDDVVMFNHIRAKTQLKQNNSIGAFVQDKNKLVGVILGGVMEKNSAKIDFLKEGLKMSLDLQGFHNFFKELESDMFDLLEIDRVCYSGLACIHPDYRGKGMDTSLRNAFADHALQSDCQYVVTTVTNETRIQVAQRAGIVVLKEVKYHDYHDPETKSTIFKSTKYPYIRAQLICKSLQDSKNKSRSKI